VISSGLFVIASNIVNDMSEIPFENLSPLLALLSDLQKEAKYIYNHPIQERKKVFSDTNGKSGIYC
jgi:hypothetical protein